MAAWCDSCSGYHEPVDEGALLTCSNCGAELASEASASVGQSAPWHFWIVVGLLAAYLLWRLIDGVIWALS